jgi:hypothetical protein
MTGNKTLNEVEYLAACGLQGEGGGASIKFGDSANIDGNNRLRVAGPVNLFLNKNIHTDNETIWEEPMVGAIIEHGTVTGGPFQVGETITGGTSGTTAVLTIVTASTVSYDVNHNDFEDGETITGGTSGATATVTTHNTGSDISHARDIASSVIQVGKVAGDSAIRQTHRYVSYVPGKNQHITITFLFGEAVVGITRRVGSFNGENGLFLEQADSAIRVVRRTKTSGSSVDHPVEQADWNLDKLDGTGESGITLDLSKAQFLIIDYVWQGVGRVRWGFELGGVIIYFHQEAFTNVSTVPFVSTPSLPIKLEILNTAGTDAVHTVKEICTSVVSEGGENLPGLGFAVSNEIAARTINTTPVPILAIRLKANFGDGPNRKTVEFVKGSFFLVGNGQAHWELHHVHGPTALGAAELVPNRQDQHRFLSQNVDSTNSQVFVLYGQSFAGDLAAYGVLGWIEYE